MRADDDAGDRPQGPWSRRSGARPIPDVGCCALRRLGGDDGSVKKLIGVAAAVVALAATPTTASARQSYIICHNPGLKPTWAFRLKPVSCTSLGPRDPFGLAVNLVQLRWKGWGRRFATFTGYERGFHLPPSHIRVHGSVFRPRIWRGRRIYTRLRATSKYGSLTVALDAR
jgi:hypothetical protein